MELISFLWIFTTISFGLGLVAIITLAGWAKDLHKIEDLEKRVKELEENNENRSNY